MGILIICLVVMGIVLALGGTMGEWGPGPAIAGLVLLVIGIVLLIVNVWGVVGGADGVSSAFQGKFS